MNTSVKAIYKDGHEQVFESIEKASEVTGISVAAIKIRANKPGTGGKDKTTFIWCDEKTARHYRAKKSKSKGQSLEFDIVKNLKNIGYESVCRSAGESKKLDNNKVDIADPSGELEVAIQAKCYQNFPPYFDIRDSCPDKREFVMIWKKSASAEGNSRGTVAVISDKFFYKLLECYHKSNE